MNLDHKNGKSVGGIVTSGHHARMKELLGRKLDWGWNTIGGNRNARKPFGLRRDETPAELIRRLVESHVERVNVSARRRHDVALPLIPASETDPIQPVTGMNVDQILAIDHLSA